MKFLKKNLKVIIAFILGFILAGGIAYAAVSISAGDIDYTTSKNANIKNVGQALNDLYNKSASSDLEIDNNYFESSYGTEAAVKSISKVLPIGKYIISTADSTGTSWSSTNYSEESDVINLTGDKNCVITKIDEHNILASGKRILQFISHNL